MAYGNGNNAGQSLYPSLNRTASSLESNSGGRRRRGASSDPTGRVSYYEFTQISFVHPIHDRLLPVGLTMHDILVRKQELLRSGFERWSSEAGVSQPAWAAKRFSSQIHCKVTHFSAYMQINCKQSAYIFYFLHCFAKHGCIIIHKNTSLQLLPSPLFF